eukprot:TRINITY_DN43933_c0_g1_i1.p1 TRINITY_DN43933_c0_g1~~TRINITY_DN43933_c0_g1_i1.p1  ORF type:complete len:1116 (+),score=414.40 TRINITY_DN43933_c0_g1_i1:52-3348(+)
MAPVATGWQARLKPHWSDGGGTYWWQDPDDTAARRRAVVYMYLEDHVYQQYRTEVAADRLVAADGSVRWVVKARKDADSGADVQSMGKSAASPRAAEPTPSPSPLSLHPPAAGQELLSPHGSVGDRSVLDDRSSSPGASPRPTKPGGKKHQERLRRRPHPLAVKTHNQLLGQRLKFDDAQEGQTVRMTPHGCDPTLAAECLYTGTIVAKDKDFITVLWNNADEHGPPERFGMPPRPDRERQEPRHWWDGLGNPVLGELTVEQKFRQRKMRKEAKEAHATRKALLEPRPEHEKLRERHQFQELKQSRDDFLVVLGGGEDENSARIFKRRHITTYGAQDQKVGFTTPHEIPYRPLGERSRRIQTKVKDLTSGLRYPPQTLREQRRRQERLQKGPQLGPNLADVTKQAVIQKDAKDRQQQYGRGGRPKERLVAQQRPKEEEEIPAQRFLSELLKKVDRLSDRDDREGWQRPAEQKVTFDDKAPKTAIECTPAHVEGVRELVMRRRQRRQRRLEEAAGALYGDADTKLKRDPRDQLCVGDIVGLAKAPERGENAGLARSPAATSQAAAKPAGCLRTGEVGVVVRDDAGSKGLLVRGPRDDTSWYREAELSPRRPKDASRGTLYGFTFPREELEQSRLRVDHARKGESFISGLEMRVPDDVLFPPVERKEGECLSQRAQQEAAQATRQRAMSPPPEELVSSETEDELSDRSSPPAPTQDPRRPSRPATAPPCRRRTGAGVFITEVTGEPAVSPTRTQPPPSTAAAMAELETHRLVARALRSREWRKKWHSGKQVHYFEHVKTGRRVRDIGAFLRKHPTGDEDAIGNWRLRCVEQFDPQETPHPRKHERVLRDGQDLDVHGHDCDYWRTRFLHTQHVMHGRLHAQLDRRRQNRGRVYSKVDLLHKMLSSATDQAAAWQLTGQTGVRTCGRATPRPPATPSPAPPEARTPPRRRPPSAPPTRGVNVDVWTKSMRDLSKRESDLTERQSFYDKVLYYCDQVGAPSTQACRVFVSSCRQLLIRRVPPSKDFLCRVLSQLPPGVLLDTETEKVLKAMRADLSVSLDDIVAWFESQGQRAPADVESLRAKERPAGLASYDAMRTSTNTD